MSSSSGCRDQVLPEVKLHCTFLDEGLQAILNTLFFVRAPSVVKAKDRRCEQLSPLMFSSCGTPDMDKAVSDTIELFKRGQANKLAATNTTSSSAPYQHRAEILISFYEKKEVKEWMGLVARTELVYFERWKIPVTLLDRPNTGTATTVGDGSDLAHAYRNAYDHVTKCIVSIIDIVNNSTDHVPLTNYEFEIHVVDAAPSMPGSRR